MSKNSWIMFAMTSVVLISILLVALLILVPQGEPTKGEAIDEYDGISKSEYMYTQSKDISEEAMKETYSITSEDINEGKASKLYKQGNVDPFAAAENNTVGSASTADNTSGSKGSSSGSSTTVRPYSAENK